MSCFIYVPDSYFMEIFICISIFPLGIFLGMELLYSYNVELLIHFAKFLSRKIVPNYITTRNLQDSQIHLSRASIGKSYDV